ncbi:uncharacterized protein LOC118605401 [Rousettus aegyptiacus]|uniref:uncharacterized protein LOC118605401 n=1 Tax=Rousettus aegyptiacus TaxID=9407 RepID=UPI00168CED9B|nr:uncharacterized protein LOC118605401 [Rousettus aegyptiacus]
MGPWFWFLWAQVGGERGGRSSPCMCACDKVLVMLVRKCHPRQGGDGRPPAPDRRASATLDEVASLLRPVRRQRRAIWRGSCEPEIRRRPAASRALLTSEAPHARVHTHTHTGHCSERGCLGAGSAQTSSVKGRRAGRPRTQRGMSMSLRKATDARGHHVEVEAGLAVCLRIEGRKGGQQHAGRCEDGDRAAPRLPRGRGPPACGPQAPALRGREAAPPRPRRLQHAVLRGGPGLGAGSLPALAPAAAAARRPSGLQPDAPHRPRHAASPESACGSSSSREGARRVGRALTSRLRQDVGACGPRAC